MPRVSGLSKAVYLGQRVIMLSAAPTTVVEDLDVDLPAERDQLTTRGDQRFTELRARVYAQIRKAKGRPTAQTGLAQTGDGDAGGRA